MTFCLFSGAILASENFSFHMHQQPLSLDPAHIRGQSGTYFYHALYQGLFKFDNKKGLVPTGAKSCTYMNNNSIVCTLKKDYKFSDGTPIKAINYVWAFQRLVMPSIKTVQTELILNLKNAQKILLNKLKAQHLGVKATGPYTLEFQLERPDGEFLYKLINPSLSPIPSVHYKFTIGPALITPGPYKIKAYKLGHKFTLTKNPYYPQAFKDRPDIDVYFIEDDSTALSLYEKGILKFLRRISTIDMLALKHRSEFFYSPFIRFDYMGFGSHLKKHINLKKALVYSLNYKDLQKLYNALGTPGCPSLPSSFFKTYPCYEFNLKKAKQALKLVPKVVRQKKIIIVYSKIGGESVLKGMEWMQYQWKQHLGLNVELRPIEQGMFLQELRYGDPIIFRKGVGVDRPTCLAALEVFEKSSRENYIKFSNHKYQKILKKLSLSKVNKSAKQILCSKAMQILMANYNIIPLGEIHYSMMTKKNFTGWSLNYLNQLDLSYLKLKTVSK